MSRSRKLANVFNEFENDVTEEEEIINNNQATDQSNDTTFKELIRAKSNKKTVEQTHTRRTFLIENDILNVLDKMSKQEKRGFQTYFVNYALKKALKELE